MKKSVTELKKILKLELVNNFYKKTNGIFATHFELIKLVSSENLRKSHWVNIYEIELNLQVPDKIYLHELFEHHLELKVEKLAVIVKRATNQRELRVKCESFLSKWHNYKLEFN